MPKIEKNGTGPLLPVRCGQCVHLNDIPAFAEVCAKLGVTNYALPCPKFQANWKLYQYSKDFAKQLRSTASDNLSNLLALIYAEINTRRAKYYYGMVVYVRLYGEDYLSNYAKCYVISAQGRYVYVQGARGDYYGAFLKKSILKESQFQDKIIALARAGKYRDPKINLYTSWKPVKRGSVDIKDIPTIDKLYELAKPKKDPMATFSVNAFE